MKKIACYKIRHDDQELINAQLKIVKNYKMSIFNNFEDLRSLELDDFSGAFIYIDESLDIREFEILLKAMGQIPLNIILKYKNFDFLMLCYKYQVSTVFEAKLNQVHLENAFVKIDLLTSKKNESFPVLEIVKLLSAPVKIKTNLELYHRLSGYLTQFKEVKHFSLICIESDSLSRVGDILSAELENKIQGLDIPEKYIGHEISMSFGEDQYVATPVFSYDNQKVWLVVQINLKDQKYVLNKQFYKFLENTLIYRMNKEKEQSLEVLATTDDVTGLFNQRKLSDDLENAIEIHEKQHEKFSIMFVDIDHFKSVNDNYGHVIGSKLLQDIGEVLSLILRASDHIYRYGGDEFVVIMPTVEIETVHEIASRVLMKIKKKDFDIGNGEIYNLSVSIGIAEYPTDARSAIEIIQFADEMMYMSKRSGRGKVFHVNEVENVDASSE